MPEDLKCPHCGCPSSQALEGPCCESAHKLATGWIDSGRRDPESGKPILYMLVKDRVYPPACALCDEGTCVQRVETCEGWEGDLIIHGMQEETS